MLLAADIKTIAKLGEELSVAMHKVKYTDLLNDEVQCTYALNDDNKLIGLNLAGLKLKKVPDAVFSFKQLQALFLNTNLLTQIPAEIGQLKALTVLSLTDNKITALPNELFLLNKLERLHLGFNAFTKIPKEVFKLVSLKKLFLHNNRLEFLPSELFSLSKLLYLTLNANPLGAVPTEIHRLTNLIYLNLDNTKLDRFPKEIMRLVKLKVLCMAHNRIPEIPLEITYLLALRELQVQHNLLKQLPEGLAQLPMLKSLSVEHNNLRMIPPALVLRDNLKYLNLAHNKLKNLPAETGDTKMRVRWEAFASDKKGFLVEGNPLQSPPIEVVKEGNENIARYLKNLGQETENSRLFEAKLLIVGQGGVGKSCLMQRMVSGSMPAKDQTTEGIDIHKWLLPMEDLRRHNRKAFPAKEGVPDDFTINFWDFGGQEIYHATHQFFLTKRSLYLLVWEARRDDNIISFDYWLNVINLLSNNAPIIVVMNKMDERIKTLDEQTLQEKFPNIKAFLKVSAKDDMGVNDLVQRISYEMANMEHIGDTLPKVWQKVRTFMEGLHYDYIEYDEYLEICKTYGMERKDADVLAQYFHDLGVFLHFKESAILSNIIFLSPAWATNSVYRVVDNKEVIKSHGKVNYADLYTIWHDLPSDKYQYLLELMKRFELCFQLPGSNEYIFPGLLRAKQPKLTWDDLDNLTFEYQYDFMPAGIMARFIVRSHDLINEDTYWKYGCLLQREGTQALVSCNPLDRKLSIKLRGRYQRELLAIIRREIAYINKSLNNPRFTELVPCICTECRKSSTPYFHEYATLLKFRGKGVPTIRCTKSTEEIFVERLLGDYELNPTNGPRNQSTNSNMNNHIEVNPTITVSPTIVVNGGSNGSGADEEQDQVDDDSQGLKKTLMRRRAVKRQQTSRKEGSLKAEKVRFAGVLISAIQAVLAGFLSLLVGKS